MSIDDVQLIFAFLFSVTILIVLISRFSLSPFVSLIVATIVLSCSAGLDLGEAWQHFSGGVGGVLSSTAMVIGLGAMTGILLQRSGGAEVIANRMVGLLGVDRLGWSMLAVGLLVGVGVWFTVGLVLLVPIAISLAKVARVSLLIPAMSMLAGLSAMHGLAPPHPGPLVAINLLEADTGRTILWSLLVGSLSAAIAGPLFWRLFEGKISMPEFSKAPAVPAENSDATPQSRAEEVPKQVGLGASLLVIALPILLMLIGSFVEEPLASSGFGWSRIAMALRALGTPTIAMLIGLLLAYFQLGVRSGFSRKAISQMTEESLFPVANVLLVVGAGAGYSKVLIACGVGDTLASMAQQIPVDTMILGWLIAAAFRVTTGSATTAITAAGGIVSVMVAGDASINRELLVLALGAGSLTLSHVNDGGFWFVKELFALTVPQTLKTWTVLETVLSLVALLIVLLLNYLV
ncbi:GntT/GntP/DsdX family permease [Aureliella helgolandensis]|uniref:High-affinity gluconate transporter n=1 Tax=Aureliella helgolandensis TaxID=2527968 RepID=A0A518GAJ0_9BACT|nr:gluconate:H+ symporter [Aureliella helgolandensis]QDV25600.1 High-affinity gluconate transporter [Aureliella helgolandensis]